MTHIHRLFTASVNCLTRVARRGGDTLRVVARRRRWSWPSRSFCRGTVLGVAGRCTARMTRLGASTVASGCFQRAYWRIPLCSRSQASMDRANVVARGNHASCSRGCGVHRARDPRQPRTSPAVDGWDNDVLAAASCCQDAPPCPPRRMDRAAITSGCWALREAPVSLSIIH